MRSPLLLALLAVTLLAAACGTTRQSGICGAIPPEATATGDADALVAEGRAAWALRADEAQLRKAIDAWTRALAIDPSRADLRVDLARAHYFLADGHLRFDDAKQQQMLDAFKQATNEAELALGQKYPAFRAKFCARQPFETALQQLDKGAIPAMYWYATALGKYALATSIVEVLNQKDRIKAMMDYIRTTEAGFYFQGADRYFGAYYTKIPFPNGDLPKSAQHFEASLAAAPQYLATRVLYAELNAIKAGNRALFQRLLQEVLDYDVSQAPEIEAENLAEQRKARELLEEIDVYFPEG